MEENTSYVHPRRYPAHSIQAACPRKNKNMPLALLDQSVHRCVHLWGRLHCGPDDQQILRPEKNTCSPSEELLSMAAIAQSTPGAIAVNLSALAGHRTAGLPGVLASCLGAVIPPLVILSAVASWYEAFSSSTAVEAVLRGCRRAWQPSSWTLWWTCGG